MGESSEGGPSAPERRLAELEQQQAEAAMSVAVALMTMQMAHQCMVDECRKAARWLWGYRALLFMDASCFGYDLARIEVEPLWGPISAVLVAASALYLLRHEHRHAGMLKRMRSDTAASGKQIKAFERRIKNESRA